MSVNEKQYKKTNARVMKWREMLSTGLFKDPELLLRRVRKGIPKCMRIKVWPELVGKKKLKESKSASYSIILIKESLDVYDINLDIPRTFSFQSQEVLRQSLFNVLKALSIEFPAIGYCQGMNFLTMRLLEILPDDIVFYILTYTIKNYSSIYDNFRNPGFVNRQNSVFLKLLHAHHPKIFAILQEQNIEPVLYTPSWFVTLFSKSLKSELFYRFFQCFLLEGYCFLYKMSLALVKIKQKQILNNSLQENLFLLPNMSYYDSISNDIIISTAAEYKISNQTIQKLEKQYSKQHQGEIRKIQHQIQQSYTKKVQSPNRAIQWTYQDFEKANSSLIRFDDQ